MNLHDLTTSELVIKWEKLNPDTMLLSSGDKSREELIEGILIAQKEKTSKITTRTIRKAAIDFLCRVSFYEDKRKKPGSNNIIDDAGWTYSRSVGLPYNKIIDMIHEEFPGCNTSVACLRWYCVKIRVEELGYEGLTLPQRRPRMGSKW